RFYAIRLRAAGPRGHKWPHSADQDPLRMSPYAWRAWAATLRTYLQHFEYAGGSHSSADAHGDDAELFVAALELVHELQRQDCACRAKRVTERDGAAVDVDFVFIEAKMADDLDRL